MASFFTYEERLTLQKLLKEGLSFKKIAAQLHKDPSTISREVRKYAVEIATGKPGYPFNACKNRFSCKIKPPALCGKDCTRNASTNSACRLCRCNEHCEDFVEEVCVVRTHVPYVCNACPTIDKCTLLKTFYDAEKAHLKSHQVISESRSGLSTSEAEIARLNKIITPLVKQGHSIHEIYVTNQDQLMCSEKTIYNYIDDCLLDVRNIDLPRKVRFRARRKKPEFKVEKGCRVGRSYKAFEAFMEKNPDTAVVQMDSVIGSIGGKCLLTIHFVESSLMLAFLRDANTSQSVIDIYDKLDKNLGAKLFDRLFPVILTDNGSEFSNPKKIEYREHAPAGSSYLRTRMFYCDAGCPYQKGAIEVNHELIRRILPKGTSFDNLTQTDVTRMMDHINSYKRKKLNDRSPYETFSFHYGEEVLKLLGCTPVAAEDILLKPSLLKKIIRNRAANTQDLYRQIQGWNLRLQKNREGVDLPLACLSKPSYTEKSLLNRSRFVYKCGFSLTNLASCVQNWRFVYKYSLFNLQTSISPYKLASRITTQHAYIAPHIAYHSCFYFSTEA